MFYFLLFTLVHFQPAHSDQIQIGDMVLEAESIIEIGVFGAIRLKLEPWEDGILPVEFSDKISIAKKKKFFDACREWSKVANVRCQEKAYKGRKLKIWANNKLGCWSLYGMGSFTIGFKRKMNLANGCWSKSTLMHEIGHAFGLIHEHQREDRDQFIKILEYNVSKGFGGLSLKINYDKQRVNRMNSYDFYSIMHYSRRSGSKNGRDTILPLAEYSKFANIIGRVQQLSDGDKDIINQLYGPPVGSHKR